MPPRPPTFPPMYNPVMCFRPPQLDSQGLSLLMPAPWRKLVRVDFCVAHGCNFPTGDFFYEDNVLHWHLILKASRMLVVPQVVQITTPPHPDSLTPLTPNSLLPPPPNPLALTADRRF